MTRDDSDHERRLRESLDRIPLREQQPGLQRHLKDAQGGSVPAFKRLYDLTYGIVELYLRMRCGNIGVTNILLRATYMRARAEIAKADPHYDPALWLLSIAREIASTHVGEFSIRIGLSATDPDQDDEDFTNAMLLDAARQLKPHQQEYIVLRHIMHFSDDEAGRITNETAEEVRTALVTGIRKMEKYLMSEEA